MITIQCEQDEENVEELPKERLQKNWREKNKMVQFSFIRYRAGEKKCAFPCRN